MDNKEFLKDNLIAKWSNDCLEPDEKNKLEASGELEGLKIVLEDIDTWKVPKFDTQAGLEDLKKRKKNQETPVKKLNINHWIGIAASILVLITTSYISWNYFTNQPLTYATQIGEQKTITLPNGSKVKLDALSTISYREKDWKARRILELSGQAFFDVTKGSPFQVNTEKGNVQVLGTQFNVNERQQTFSVVCYEGKVKVTYQNQEKIITQGQAVHQQENKLINSTHKHVSPEWTLGYNSYAETSLSEVVNDLEKYYPIIFKLPQKYHDLKFTGKLPLKNLDTALETLFVSMEISYHLDADNNVIIEE